MKKHSDASQGTGKPLNTQSLDKIVGGTEQVGQNAQRSELCPFAESIQSCVNCKYDMGQDGCAIEKKWGG